ncbi:MAG: TetR/AcrR family transcriptional regulator [Inquilinus limosus]|uniref:TetR/AcrR family transcriptional regulator n=1 Tax=Inquilinus limosus TaxID=171674 RepID=A0A952KD65_9PROT|nr:TetR/AcrR family transcriptional regulator [Inquilinus limosus]
MASRPAARRGPKPKPGTRGTLVQAGLGIMHAEGYAATGIQAIVEGAGVPKGSFYNHFASKEAFGAEVIDAYSERGQAKLRAILTERAPGRPFRRLDRADRGLHRRGPGRRFGGAPLSRPVAGRLRHEQLGGRAAADAGGEERRPAPRLQAGRLRRAPGLSGLSPAGRRRCGRSPRR